MKNDNLQKQLCPCCSGKDYQLCCKSYVEQTIDAPTALALMRSRYTAFTQLNENYLHHTWHPDTCPKYIHLNENTQWLGLKIKSTIAGGEKDTTGEVEFVARSKINGKASRLHERSQFRKVDNRWVYLDGKITTK